MIIMEKKVSIITPTFNRASQLERLWRSLESQTFNNFEWIVVDDASVDNTEINIKGINDSRIIYTKLSQNSGQNAARNLGNTLVSGDYVVYLDSDDTFLDSTSLELMVNEIINTPDSVGTVAFAVVTTSGITKSYIGLDRLTVFYPESVCRKRVKGEFLSIQKRKAALSVEWPAQYRGIESLRHYKISEKFGTLFIDKPTRVYFDDRSDNETGAENMLKNIPVLIAGTIEILKRYKLVWKIHNKQQYGSMLFKLAFYQILAGSGFEGFKNTLKSIFNRGPLINNFALLLLLLLPQKLRRFIFIKTKKFLTVIF